MQALIALPDRLDPGFPSPVRAKKPPSWARLRTISRSSGGLPGYTDAQHAPAAYSGRDHAFFSVQPRALLIGHHILGHLGLVLDGCSDQIGLPKAKPDPIPKHRIAPKDFGQRPEGHAPVAQEERFLHVLSPRNAVGQDKGGPQRKDLPARLELDPSQHDLVLMGPITVVEGIPLAQGLRKQFGLLRPHLRQILTICCHVVHTLLILRFILERHADMLAATGWGPLLHICVLHHFTVWSIFMLPSS